MSAGGYRLDAAISVRKLVQQLEREARVQGLARSFARGLGTIRRDLTDRPTEVGIPWSDQSPNQGPSELFYRLHYVAPVQVLFAVHEASETIWLRDIRLLPALN